jgi:two-component system, OmpR family, sensor histidine kinase KdpD
MVDDFKRPDPDQLLEKLQAEAQPEARGRLKIFLGYVAGVGKTYAMLEAAHQRKNEGQDVVIAYIETHGRKETEQLAQGLEVIPRQRVEYHGTVLSEMDLDGILRRQPKLALVDELAHTNAPGTRHLKRYLDVEELLSAGIDVYTTVNIQHLESLKDVVQQITGVTVRETVPDRIVDEAYEIELVDLPTDELLQRLKEGKVYVPDQASRALELFFRKGNLTALRELSMRRAAERIDSQMVSYMQTKSIPGPWPAGDRILICLSSHPLGERLVRSGRKLADDLNAEWYVLFVETPGHLHMPDENRLRIQQNLRLAEELGARVMNITSESVPEAVLSFAHQHNITKIIAGKPLRPRWFELLRGTVIDQIIRRSGKIDVYVISEEAQAGKPSVSQSGGLKKAQKGFLPNAITPHPPLGRYFLSLGLVGLLTLLGFPLRTLIDPTNLVMLYLLAVVIAAVFLGRGPAVLASIVSVLAFDFFFVDPRYNFSVSDTQYILTFLGLLIVGLIISSSASLLRDQVEILRMRQRQSEALNQLSRELTAAITLDQVLNTVIRNLAEMFNRDAVILLPADHPLVPENRFLAENLLFPKAATPELVLDEGDRAVAEWAYKNNQPAGYGTHTLPAAKMRFIPLVTVRGTIGVLGIKAPGAQKSLSFDQRMLLEGVVNLSALAIDRASYAEKAAQTEMLRNTEKLQTALLNSISHELRTPLAAITGVLTSLGESGRGAPENQLDPATSLELIDAATRQAGRLNHLVGNLLDMTRLEAGAMRLNREPTDLLDLVNAAVEHAEGARQHAVQIHVPADLPLVSIDAVLIAQVLTNLLDNACKYSPPGSPIDISAALVGDQVRFAVQDCGIGIPAEDLERVFDKFYRVRRQETTSGTGLGLSICRGIVEAHGGKIWAMNNLERGVTVIFVLPLGTAARGKEEGGERK